jgi:hypothetical protein
MKHEDETILARKHRSGQVEQGPCLCSQYWHSSWRQPGDGFCSCWHVDKLSLTPYRTCWRSVAHGHRHAWQIHVDIHSNVDEHFFCLDSHPGGYPLTGGCIAGIGHLRACGVCLIALTCVCMARRLGDVRALWQSVREVDAAYYNKKTVEPWGSVLHYERLQL